MCFDFVRVRHVQMGNCRDVRTCARCCCVHFTSIVTSPSLVCLTVAKFKRQMLVAGFNIVVKSSQMFESLSYMFSVQFYFMIDVQTLADLRSSCVLKSITQLEFYTNMNWIYMSLTTHVKTRAFRFNPNCNIVGPHWPQHDSPAVRVIAQQYSSSLGVPWRFHSCKEKLDAITKNVVSMFLYLNCVTLKLRSFELRKSGSVCYVKVQTRKNYKLVPPNTTPVSFIMLKCFYKSSMFQPN
jgi:hypothetical protein